MAGNGRAVVAFGIIAVMLVALVFLLIDGGDDDPVAEPSTSIVSTTTSTTKAPTTGTRNPATTTTSLDPDARMAEVEQILTDLYVGWYGAVYDKDEGVLVDLVAIQLLYDAAVEAMSTSEFVARPSPETVGVEVMEILLDRSDCLVVYRDLDLSNTLVDAESNAAVQILWPSDTGRYRMARLWSSPSDLWQDDCDLMERDEIP